MTKRKIITKEEMKEAIKKSGYPLEQRVEAIFRNNGYLVTTNPVFPDPETGKSREYDINALSCVPLFKKNLEFPLHALWPTLLCECKNNEQPVVFFNSKSPVYFLSSTDTCACGIPVQFSVEDGFISFNDFVKMDKFHHYCKGKYSTQYCSFKNKGSEWLALHEDEHHDSLKSLLNAVEHEISSFYENWTWADKIEEEEVDIRIHYPVLILQGDIFTAESNRNQLSLKKCNHVILKKELYLPQRKQIETFYIDIIQEKYLPRYLKIIDYEVQKIKTALKNKKSDVFASMEKINTEAKKEIKKRRGKSIRELLEF